MTADRLGGRRVLVCGGATGIGAATARTAAREGAAVYIHYHTRVDEAIRLRDELYAGGASAETLQADLTREEDVERLAAAVGDLHGLVHSISPPLPRTPFDRTGWHVYEEHWAAAVKALYLLTRYVLPSAPALESIVAVLSASVVGVPPKDMAAYLTAKHALHGFCRSMAVELAPRGIRVNCVSPGMTPTPLTSYLDARHHGLLGRTVPAGRVATAEDAAHAIVFLLGPESAYMTGTNLAVAGGAVM